MLREVSGLNALFKLLRAHDLGLVGLDTWFRLVGTSALEVILTNVHKALSTARGTWLLLLYYYYYYLYLYPQTGTSVPSF